MVRRQWSDSAALLLLVLSSSLLHLSCWAASEEAETFIVKYQPGQRAQVLIRIRQHGYDLVREYREYNRLVISAKGAPAAGSGTSGRLTEQQLEAQAVELQGIAAVTGVQYNRQLSVLPSVALVSTAASGSGGQPASCSSVAAENPDINMDRVEEGVPFAVKRVQASLPPMKLLARRHAERVLYCVVDNGMDASNQEFSKQVTSGCTPGSGRSCYNWNEPANDHGTHVSGIIAALRNQKGVVGVSPDNARLYHYKIQDGVTFPADTQIAAWQECIAELDRQKASSKVSDMKLVIVMSYGAQVTALDNNTTPTLASSMDNFEQEALNAIMKQRNDVMFVAAAGDAGPGSVFVPAAYDHVISVGSVNSGSQVAPTSSTNQYVDLTAPGVNIVSTIPTTSANARRFYEQGIKGLIRVNPSIPALEADPELFYRPAREIPEGAATDHVAAQLIDCGTGDSACFAANNKICLIERGGSMSLCQKVKRCAFGGGIGVIFYNSADYATCDPMTGTSLVDGDCSCVFDQERGTCMTAVALARAQGLALKEALEAGLTFTVELNFPRLAYQNGVGLGIESGTSMANAAAAGIAGVVWSANTKCTVDEIRNALFATAVQPAVNASTGERNDEYGYGLVQGLAAHQYLQRNPCAGNRTLNGEIAVAGGLTQRVGASSTVSYKLTDAITGQPIVGRMVLVTSQPSRKFFACDDMYLRTNTLGSVSTLCRFLKPSNARIVFTTSKGRGTLMHQAFKNITIIAA